MSTFLKIFALWLLLSADAAYSQTINWPDRTGKTYVFEISGREAGKLLKSRPSEKLITGMLHTQVASLGEWYNKPDRGHFIFAEIVKDRVNYRYAPVIPFQVFLFKQYGVLTLQVVDDKGNIRRDARVKLNRRRIGYDSESRTYSVDDWSERREHILTVRLDGFTAIFDLTKRLVDPWNSYNSGEHSPSFYSYMITDKNRYKPGETVRFKSYALSGNRRPLKDGLTVWVATQDHYRYKQVGTVQAHHPGGFAGELTLHDSLKMKLDKQYPLQLRDRKGRIVASTSFRYEDYELYGNKLQIRLDQHAHYCPDTNRLEISATDANGLFLQGMQAEVTVRRRNVLDTYADLVLLPDTLLHRRIELNGTEPVTVDIPHTLFGEADCAYDVEVLVLSFDNQRMIQRDMATFFRRHHSIAYDMHGDTLRFGFYELGRERTATAELSYNNGEGVKTVQLPYEEKFDQKISSYNLRIQQPACQRTVFTSAVDNGFSIKGGFSADSFNVKLINPLQLDVSWYVYQGSKLLQKGSGRELDFKSAEADWNTAYYVEVFYFMGDREQVYRRVFTPQADYLSVNVDLPERVYPGQTVDASIRVTDHLGQPVPKVDLTAFGFNSMLNYAVPDLPYYGDPPNTREQRASYSMRKREYTYSTGLDFKFWNRQAGLDRYPYYRFAYPHGTLFTHTVSTPDSTTQVAPYVMKNGRALTVYVIEIDDRPVYFSWTQQPGAYSFLCPDTPCKVSLRLYNKVIVLQNIRFERGKKTVLSLDVDNLPKTERPKDPAKPTFYIVTVDAPASFTDTETSRYRRYIARFPVSSRDSAVYLTVKNRQYLIFHSCLMQRADNVLAGPLPEGLASYAGSVEYRHEGGYAYAFAGNVVYKLDTNIVPPQLTSNTSLDFGNLNDFVLTPAEITKKARCRQWNDWFPRHITIAQDNMNLNFVLPVEADSSGVAALLFRESETGKMLFPGRYGNLRYFISLKSGIFDAILLYNNGKYLKLDRVPFTKNAWLKADMSRCALHQPDTLSEKWLSQYTPVLMETKPAAQTYFSKPVRNGAWTVNGLVYDESGEGLPGASVVIKGTSQGAVSDINGAFSIQTADNPVVLVFSFIGYKRKELQVMPGSRVEVTLEEDERLLEEVVVVAYGTMRRVSVSNSLAGRLAGIAVSDSQANRQAPPEKLEDDAADTDDSAAAEETLYNELLQLNGLRSNFSDAAFWEPRLYTDRKGTARFSVTFPDDITRWDAVVYAMNRHLKTGTARRSIQSYKPVMAELKTPRFLTVGDTSYLSVSVRNCSKDPQIEGTVHFAVNGDTLTTESVQVTGAHADRLPVTAATSDSITARYTFTRTDGYMDGEERSIPVVPQGVTMAKGSLGFLNNGDEVQLDADGEELRVKIVGSQLNVYLDVVQYLTGYAYACNEQLASKLIGLLGYRLYAQYAGKKFTHDRNVNEIIRRLMDNRNDSRLWSWWGRSAYTSYWMSAHIMRALQMARDAGYEVPGNMNPVEATYADIAPYQTVSLRDMDVFHALVRMGMYPDCAKSVELFEKMVRRNEHREDSIARVTKDTGHPYWPQSYLREKMQLLEIRQLQGLDYEPDSISRYLHRNITGAVYCGDDRPRYWYSDKLAVTLMAYRIVKNDSTLRHFKEPMQMYVLSTGPLGWNTWQAASAVADIMPDLLGDDGATKDKPATIQLTGKENGLITKFPYETRLQPGEHLGIAKQSGLPLIYTAYRLRRTTTATSGDGFEISTRISGGDTLKAGVPATLTVKLEVKQEGAEHILIEAPIPASCSYASKQNAYAYRNHEVHREYFKEKTAIFCESLPPGTYYFDIELLPRYTGRYILNPAKAEMMYLPVINANNDMRKVEVTERE